MINETRWKDYKWERSDGVEVISGSRLCAKNLHHAKHLVSVYSEIPKGKWIDRKDCAIMPIPDTNQYLSIAEV